MDKGNIAKELTLALINKLSDGATIKVNDLETCASVVATTYKIIYHTLDEIEKNTKPGVAKIV